MTLHFCISNVSHLKRCSSIIKFFKCITFRTWQLLLHKLNRNETRTTTAASYRFLPYAPAGCVKKKRFLGRAWLANIPKVTSHARNALTKDGVSSLSFGALMIPKVSVPCVRIENKLSCKAHRYAYSKHPDEENRHVMFPKLFFQYFEQLKRKQKWRWPSSLFPWIFSKISEIEHFGSLKICLPRQELLNEETMSSVRHF